MPEKLQMGHSNLLHSGTTILVRILKLMLLAITLEISASKQLDRRSYK